MVKPRTVYTCRFFPDQRLLPDIQVNLDGTPVAIYDSKLYRNGHSPQTGHKHQVEAYCVGVEHKANRAQGDRTHISHAGLICAQAASFEPSNHKRKTATRAEPQSHGR